jgi:hypothetical protein
MSYRRSTYEPLASTGPGRPARPYDRTQRVGVGFMILGLILLGLQLAGIFGVAALASLKHVPVVLLTTLGVLLINSRREPIVDPAPELAQARRKWLVIVGAACGLLLGLALVLASRGY